jgi:ankyrin repeat protein
MPPSKKKRDISRQDAGKQLYAAATEGDGAAVARLLAAGADPDASVAVRDVVPSGEFFHEATALLAAVGRGRMEAARLLLDAGAVRFLAAGDGTTPLMNAAVNGQPEVLRLLLGRGAAVDATEPGQCFTAFH